MKILLYSDNHFCQYSSIIRNRGEKFSSRLENQIDSINWLEQIAEQEHVEKIICLGDFFDKPELNAEELTALHSINWNKNIKHEFIVGNHEMGNSDLSYNSLNALAQIGQVIDKPTLDCGYGYEIIYLPYILEDSRKTLSTYRNRLWEGLWTTDEVKNNIILSHNDLAGIQYGQYMSKSGFDIKDIDKNCSLYINGHLHNQQQITQKILNIGNLTGLNFSEDASKFNHCIGILDTETLNLDLIENPFAYNFYKLEVNNIEDLKNKLNNLNNNAILTVKINSDYIDEARQILNSYKNIKEYRVLGIVDVSKKHENLISDVISADHIKQFKDYVINELGSSEELLEELDRLN